ncbi:Calx-beta domain-containing protein [Pontiella sp.]|uniref:Calx-beta domain-containing protein n=1 Tax=Pontiella sp. TaxID=2837462 RepID=UPI0035638DF7
MKTSLRILSMVGLLAYGAIAQAAVTITAVGDGSGYDISGAEVAGFRSTGTQKSFDPDGDDAYGTAGYIVFGGTAVSGGGHALFGDATEYSNPSFVSAFTAGANFISISKYTSYPLYDDPSQPIAASVADFGATAVAVANANAGAGAWNEMLTFTIDDSAPQTFRVGLMAGPEGNTDGRWDPTGLRISFEGGTAVEATGLPILSGTGMVFFDIAVTDGTTGTFTIDSQRRLSTGGSSISGLTFDVAEQAAMKIKIDFGTIVSTASNWNHFSGTGTVTVSNLVNFADGADTGVSIQIAGIENQATTFSDASALGGSSEVSIYSDALQNAGTGDDRFYVTISGLGAHMPYDIFGGALNGADFGATWVCGSQTQTDTVNEGSCFATLTNVTADANGEIYFEIHDQSDAAAPAADRNIGLAELTITSLLGSSPMIALPDGVLDLYVDAATLAGTLVSTGGAPTQVWICWGESDGGTTLPGWTQLADLGVREIGAFSTQVTNLTTDTEYVYRCAASNQFGMVWTDLQSFTPSYPILSVDPVQIVEGDSGSSLAIFTVRLSRAYPAPITFSFSTVDGSAVASADYAAQSGDRTFAAGQTQLQIFVPIYGDTEEESDESFSLVLQQPANAVLGNATALGMIFSDERDAYLSPSALVADADRGLLYVAESTAARIGIVDLSADILVDGIALPQDPSGLALSSDGSTLYVTAGVSAGVVYVVDTASRTVTQTIPVGHSPRAPVLAAGDVLYVCEQFTKSVAVVDLAAGTVADRIGVLREPFAAVLSSDGTKLLVANLLPHQPSTQTGVAASVSVIDTASRLVTANIVLPPGSHSLRDLAVSPDGSYAVVGHTLGRYRVPATQLFRGWQNTSALSIVDIGSETLYNTVMVDDLDEGAANPWGIGFTADGQQLCLAHAGTHELSAIDWPGLLTKLGTASGNVCDNLAYLAGLRRRLPLPGNGPHDVAIVGTKVYAANYFSDSLAVADVTEGQEYAAQEIAIGWAMPKTEVRLGNQYFHDATLSAQQWQSCSSCHPGVRADGLNWDELNDGFGNAKNVKSLLYAHYTAPTTWTGVRPNAETSVTAGLLFSHYVKFKGDENLYVDAFLKALQPVPSPYLVAGQLSEAAARGEAIFTARCTYCHSGPYLTDQSLHDVGTSTAYETRPFDTPSLLEVWRTAPYLHDGRAQTINDVLEVFSHGSTSGLTDDEIADLVEYVNSL